VWNKNGWRSGKMVSGRKEKHETQEKTSKQNRKAKLVQYINFKHKKILNFNKTTFH
jgi:hypothetical protein